MRPISDACACGATYTITGGEPEDDAKVMQLWQSQHVGPGHSSVTLGIAAKQRKHNRGNGR